MRIETMEAIRRRVTKNESIKAIERNSKQLRQRAINGYRIVALSDSMLCDTEWGNIGRAMSLDYEEKSAKIAAARPDLLIRKWGRKTDKQARKYFGRALKNQGRIVALASGGGPIGNGQLILESIDLNTLDDLAQSAALAAIENKRSKQPTFFRETCRKVFRDFLSSLREEKFADDMFGALSRAGDSSNVASKDRARSMFSQVKDKLNANHAKFIESLLCGKMPTSNPITHKRDARRIADRIKELV